MQSNSYKGKKEGRVIFNHHHSAVLGKASLHNWCMLVAEEQGKKNVCFNRMTHFLILRVPRIRMSEFYSPYFTKVSIPLLVGLGQFQVKLQFKCIFHVQKSIYQENSLVMR